MHVCCSRSIDMDQRVNGANKANKAYAECLKFVSAGVIGFVKLNAFHSFFKIFSKQEER